MPIRGPHDPCPSSPLSLPSSPTSSVSSVTSDSTTTTDMRTSPPRVYVYARLKRGQPQADVPVAFKDLEYWLRVEHLPEVADVSMCLFHHHSFEC